jgi:cytoskeletal protein RodZ
MDDSQHPPQKRNKKIITYIIFVLIAALIGFGVYYWQSTKLADANSKISNLEAGKNTLSDENKALQDKNVNLSNSITVLQDQIDFNVSSAETNSQNNNSSTTKEPTTSIAITSIKDVSGSIFAKAGYTAPIGDFTAIYATITNISKQAQTYEINQFSAITKSGTATLPKIFSPVETEGLWNNSVVPAGDKKDIVILFETGQNLVVLNFAATAGNTPAQISVPVPSR